MDQILQRRIIALMLLTYSDLRPIRDLFYSLWWVALVLAILSFLFPTYSSIFLTVLVLIYAPVVISYVLFLELVALIEMSPLVMRELRVQYQTLTQYPDALALGVYRDIFYEPVLLDLKGGKVPLDTTGILYRYYKWKTKNFKPEACLRLTDGLKTC